MINQFEVPAYLVDELPEIKEELKSITSQQNILKTISCLASYTKKKVVQHDLRLVKKCFTIAENIHIKGNKIVKDAIENVYVYSFSSLFNLCNREEKNKIQGLIPISLYSAYIQQILKSGI